MPGTAAQTMPYRHCRLCGRLHGATRPGTAPGYLPTFSVRTTVAVCFGFEESETTKVARALAALVGVPDRTPVFPVELDPRGQVVSPVVEGGLPCEVLIFAEYFLPTVPPGSDDVVTTRAGT